MSFIQSVFPQGFITATIEKFFLNKLDVSLHSFYEEIKDLKVSAHILIKRSGEVIQFVPFNKKERGMHKNQASMEWMIATIFQLE